MFLKENIIHKNTFNYLTFLEDVINFNEEYTEIKDKIIQLEYNKVLEESILLEASSLWQKVIGFFKYLWKKILEFKNFIVSLYRKAKDWILKKFKKGDKVEVTINEATKKAEEAVKQAEDILKTQEASKEELNKTRELLKKAVDDMQKKGFEKVQQMTTEELDKYVQGGEYTDKINSELLANSIKQATDEAEKLASSNDNEKIEISREKINLGNEALKTQNKITVEKIKNVTSAKPIIDNSGKAVEDDKDSKKSTSNNRGIKAEIEKNIEDANRKIKRAKEIVAKYDKEYTDAGLKPYRLMSDEELDSIPDEEYKKTYGKIRPYLGAADRDIVELEKYIAKEREILKRQ